MHKEIFFNSRFLKCIKNISNNKNNSKINVGILLPERMLPIEDIAKNPKQIKYDLPSFFSNSHGKAKKPRTANF